MIEIEQVIVDTLVELKVITPQQRIEWLEMRDLKFVRGRLEYEANANQKLRDRIHLLENETPAQKRKRREKEQYMTRDSYGLPGPT